MGVIGSGIKEKIIYHWQFGDGTESWEECPEHKYAHAGTYTWTLDVSYCSDMDAIIEDSTSGIVYVGDEENDETQITLRLAIESQQGFGWSEITGDNWLDPVANGAFVIVDDNDVPRCLVEDEDGMVWEDTTFDRLIYFDSTYSDKFKEENLLHKNYKWTLSGGGTSEYYIQMVNTGKTFFTEPKEVYLNGIKATKGLVGVLQPGEWGWGDSDDTINKIYVRLIADEDPNTVVYLSRYIMAYWWTEIDWEVWFKELIADPIKQEESLEITESHAFFRPQLPENKGYSNYDAEGYRPTQQIDMDVYKDGEIVTPFASVTDIPENGEIIFSGYKLEDRRLQFVLKGAASEIQLIGINHHIIVKPKQLERTNRVNTESSAEIILASPILWITRDYKSTLLERISGIVLSGTVTAISGADGNATSGFLVNPSNPLNLFNSEIIGYYTIIVYSKGASLITIAGETFNVYLGTFNGWWMYYAFGVGLDANKIITSGSIFDLRIYDFDARGYLSILRDDCKNKEEPKLYLPGY